MMINDCVGDVASHGDRDPSSVTDIILHDSVTNNTLTNSPQTVIDILNSRGLGYHYLIDLNGDAYKLAEPNSLMWHAKGHNANSIGICYIGGLKPNDITQTQIDASIELVSGLKSQFPLKTLAGHRHRSTEGKIDPTGVNCQEVAITCGLQGPSTP